jgi:hypothetical protein
MPRPGSRPWSDDEDWTLCMMREHDGLPTPECAYRLDRSYASVAQRLYLLRKAGKIRDVYRVVNGKVIKRTPGRKVGFCPERRE